MILQNGNNIVVVERGRPFSYAVTGTFGGATVKAQFKTEEGAWADVGASETFTAASGQRHVSMAISGTYNFVRSGGTNPDISLTLMRLESQERL